VVCLAGAAYTLCRDESLRILSQRPRRHYGREPVNGIHRLSGKARYAAVIRARGRLHGESRPRLFTLADCGVTVTTCSDRHVDNHMGLDMYLYRKHYVKNWEHMKPEERHTVTVKKGGNTTTIKPERICEVVEEVGYWRKANAVHEWFVQNVQDGVDDCKEYSVSREQLQELLDRCRKVIASSKLVDGKIANGYRYENDRWVPNVENGRVIEDPSVAKVLLPTQEGFFFGSTDYDQYYFEDIEATEKMLTELLNEPEDGFFYYQSSW
jgi:hypothetical protein